MPYLLKCKTDRGICLIIISNNISIYFIVVFNIQPVSESLPELIINIEAQWKFNRVGNITPAHREDAGVILV